MATKNLGQIKAIHVGVTAPTNLNMLWFDDNTGVKKHKYYNTSTGLWTLLAAEVSGGILTEDFAVTVQLGVTPPGTLIPAGTSLEDMMKAAFSPYVSGSFNSLTINNSVGGTTFEVGRVITILSAVISADLDSDGDIPQGMYLEGAGFDKTVTSLTPNADASSVVTKSSDSSELWRITGYDKQASPLSSSSRTYYWRFRHYFGASSLTPSDNSSAQTVLSALTNSALATGKGRTVSCSANNSNTSNYTYIAYASKFGTLSSVILNGALDVKDAFVLVGEFSVTNAYGHAENYYFYKSIAKGAFNDSDNLVIS